MIRLALLAAPLALGFQFLDSKVTQQPSRVHPSVIGTVEEFSADQDVMMDEPSGKMVVMDAATFATEEAVSSLKQPRARSQGSMSLLDTGAVSGGSEASSSNTVLDQGVILDDLSAESVEPDDGAGTFVHGTSQTASDFRKVTVTMPKQAKAGSHGSMSLFETGAVGGGSGSNAVHDQDVTMDEPSGKLVVMDAATFATDMSQTASDLRKETVSLPKKAQARSHGSMSLLDTGAVSGGSEASSSNSGLDQGIILDDLSAESVALDDAAKSANDVSQTASDLRKETVSPPKKAKAGGLGSMSLLDTGAASGGSEASSSNAALDQGIILDDLMAESVALDDAAKSANDVSPVSDIRKETVSSPKQAQAGSRGGMSLLGAGAVSGGSEASSSNAVLDQGIILDDLMAESVELDDAAKSANDVSPVSDIRKETVSSPKVGSRGGMSLLGAGASEASSSKMLLQATRNYPNEVGTEEEISVDHDIIMYAPSGKLVVMDGSKLAGDASQSTSDFRKETVSSPRQANAGGQGSMSLLGTGAVSGGSEASNSNAMPAEISAEQSSQGVILDELSAEQKVDNDAKYVNDISHTAASEVPKKTTQMKVALLDAGVEGDGLERYRSTELDEVGAQQAVDGFVPIGPEQKVDNEAKYMNDISHTAASEVSEVPKKTTQKKVALLDAGVEGDGLERYRSTELDEVGAQQAVDGFVPIGPEQMVDNGAKYVKDVSQITSDLRKGTVSSPKQAKAGSQNAVALLDAGAVGGGSEVSSGDAVHDEVSSAESTAESSADAFNTMLDDINSEQMVDNVALEENGASQTANDLNEKTAVPVK